jgi:hypothetical protein
MSEQRILCTNLLGKAWAELTGKMDFFDLAVKLGNIIEVDEPLFACNPCKNKPASSSCRLPLLDCVPTWRRDSTVARARFGE